MKYKEQNNATALRDALNNLLHNVAAKRNIRQAMMAVESGDATFRWHGIAGNDDTQHHISADSPFFTASVTKLYTAAVVMQMHERGEIAMDTSIADYLPAGLLSNLHRHDGKDHTSAITVRHLLMHTSGLPCYFVDRPKGEPSLAQRLFSHDDMGWTTDAVIHNVRNKLKPHFPPQPASQKRPKVRYSNTNYDLLGLIIEATADAPLHVVLEERLFRPLGLHHTYVYGHSEPLNPLPPPATLWHAGSPLDRPQALQSMSAGGGIVATMSDAILFLRALMRGTMFDDPVTAVAMRDNRHRFGFPRDPVAMTLPGWPIDYGLGVMHFQLPPLFTMFRPMPAVFGHTGSTGSWLFYCPKLDIYMVGTVNEVSAGAIPYRFVPKLVQALAKGT